MRISMNKDEKKRIIVVLGMHRSGTSAITRGLQAIGVDLGDNLIPPLPDDNEKGFYEDVDINSLNGELLHALDSDWHALSLIPVAAFKQERLAQFRLRAITIIRARMGDSPFGLKDPRIGCLLPFWKAVFQFLNADTSYVIAIRHPTSVARSLNKRNGFEDVKGYYLWLKHVLPSILETEGAKKVVVDFDLMMADPHAQLERMAQALDLPFDSDASAVKAYVNEFLDEKLRHTKFEFEELRIDPAVPIDVIKAYEVMLCLARDEMEIDASGAMEIFGQLNCRLQSLRPLLDYTTRLERNVAERNGRIASPNQAVAERDVQICGLNQAVAERDAQISGRNQDVAERDAQISNLNQAVSERDDRITNLTDENAHRSEWALRLDAELKAATAALHVITHSKSWRLTLPLREAMRWVSWPKQQAKRYVSGGLRVAKRVYHHTVSRGGLLKKYPFDEVPLRDEHSGYSSLMKESVTPDPVAVREETLKNQLSFPIVNEPLVSVVIPVFNKFEYTWACLCALHANNGNIPTEIIIIDDGSSDATMEILPALAGLRYVRNDHNLGFLASCNRGAELARGKYLVLLNNDTEARPGWLQALLDTFSDDPLAGLVGSKFIFPDGRLSEAGGIVWRDGSACNYGRDGHPDDPQVNYRREVDYISGACIMLPRDLFNSMGGFDSQFSPAYYEDTDLAFRVREAGRKVIYQPLSEIMHHEGGTSGTDPSGGVKHYQMINQKKFYDRWKDILASHGEPGCRHEFEKERRIDLRILVIDCSICLPDQDSGSFRMLNIIRILQAFGNKVTFFPDDPCYPEPYTSRMRGLGVEVLTADAVPDIETHLAVWGERYDIVFLSRLDVARRHLDAVTRHCSRAFLCFDTVDLHFLREEREAALKGDPQAIKNAREQRNEALAVAVRADLTIVVSEAERELLTRECPDLPIVVVSNIHEVAGCRVPFDGRQDLLFVGGFRFAPNVDAVIFFVREVFPRVRQHLPHVRFHIVGSNPPEEVLALDGQGVKVHGYVPDLEPFLDRCRISVAPLRWGAGVKGKINQSMSYGLPVVATLIAAEGMYLADGEDVLIADEPDALADAVARLYSDQKLWERLSQGGLSNVHRYFSFDAARSALASVLKRVKEGAPIVKSHEVQAVPPDSVTLPGETGCEKSGKAARVIAFYLPQFHPIPENDAWWGDGFTEWRNVTRARSLFRGHVQPRLPADLGFYDLRIPEVRARQADLARTYGIEAFCYWHYWFEGKQLLERPIQEVLASGEPDFSFCLAWANETWSRRWDGQEHQILQPQTYGGEEDDRRHFKSLLPALRDPRAFRVEGLPVFLIYKARALPDVTRTVALWRKLAAENGLPGLHLLSIETSGTFGWDPREAGFDAAVEFQPNWERVWAITNQLGNQRKAQYEKRYGVLALEYSEVWPQLGSDIPPYPRYPGVCPRWDNTPRRGRAGLVFRNSRPEEYGKWLANAVARVQTQPADRRLVFINAWNEWAEGNYLEPDQEFGRAYLDATLWAVNMGNIDSQADDSAES